MKRIDYLVLLLNFETQAASAKLCSAGSPEQATDFMTAKYAEEGLTVMAVFPAQGILNLVVAASPVIARPPLTPDEYYKLRTWVLQNPDAQQAAMIFGGGDSQNMHDKLPEFIEQNRDLLTAKMNA